MKTNTVKKSIPILTEGGAKAVKINAELQLRRLVMANMLFENNFYVDGKTVANNIVDIIPKVKPEIVANIAIEAREKMKLRHVPLFIVREMARLDSHKHLVSKTLERVIQRADEITEFLAIYNKEKKQPISSQVKKGLAKAFQKFNEYNFAKYNRDSNYTLKDALFLTHAKPSKEQFSGKSKKEKAISKNNYSRGEVRRHTNSLFSKIIENKLETPETWEVILSDKNDKRTKKEKWIYLLQNNKLGGMAMLRNLRNMQEEKVPHSLIVKKLKEMKTERILPFRFISASKYIPSSESVIEELMFKCLEGKEKFKGKTILVIDTSGSMNATLSSKSDLSRLDAAAALAILIMEVCEYPVVYATAGNDYSYKHATTILPSRRGFALRDLICGSELGNKIGGGGIFLKQCVDYIAEKENSEADRIIVITDEQDCSHIKDPNKANTFGKQNYLINIASEKNGIGYGKWHHIDGFSEAVIDYIYQFENSGN